MKKRGNLQTSWNSINIVARRVTSPSPWLFPCYGLCSQPNTQSRDKKNYHGFFECSHDLTSSP